MLNDSSGLQNLGESLVAQMLNKLVFIRLKHQIASYKRHKIHQSWRILLNVMLSVAEASRV